MRISDWSSDVCSSDLLTFIPFSVAVGGEFCANCSNSVDSCLNNVTAVHADHRTQRAGQDYVAFKQRPSDTRHHPSQPQGRGDRAAKTGEAGTNRKGFAPHPPHHSPFAKVEPVELARNHPPHDEAPRRITGDADPKD